MLKETNNQKHDYKEITYDELVAKIRELYYSGEVTKPNFIDTSAEYSLDELIEMQEKGHSMLFQIGGMYTGIGGAIEYRRALQSYVGEENAKNYGEHREEEEEQMWIMTPEQKQAELDKWEKKNRLEETGQKKVRKNGNNRKRTKGRRKK